MAMFVHLAPQSRVARIRKNGIGRLRRGAGTTPGGIFAMPVTRNFYISHQWLRELKRYGRGSSIVGVYFRIDDRELVWVGHYHHAHRCMTAAEAVAEILAGDKEGWEVIISRRIEPQEIHRVRSLPQVLGWRYYPGAKGSPPKCTCQFCVRGDYGARRLRQRFPPPDG
jgi:hypothetical protein